MSQQVFSLLHSNMGREATLSADTRTRWGTRRPEILVPRRTDEDLPPEDHAPLPLEVGAQVRVLRAPYLGAIGTVKDLPAQPRRVESGARLPVAVVDVEDGEPVLVPLANLEMIR